MSTEIAGSPRGDRALTVRVDVLELRVAVGMLASLARLAIGLQAVPQVVQQPADQSG